MHFWSPKPVFGIHFAPWLKRLIKPTVSGLLFLTFWAKMQKCGHFFTFGKQNAKKRSFCNFGATNAKMSSFSVFGSQSAKKGSWNHLFNKLFGPGRKKTHFGLKMHFWAQICTKWGFWAPKRVFGSKMLFGEKGARCLHLFLQRYRQIRRVQNDEILRKFKNAKVRIEKYDFGATLIWFCKFHHKNDQICILHQTVEKQRPNGGKFGQNRKNRSFEPKITFWARNHFLSAKYDFGAK